MNVPDPAMYPAAPPPPRNWWQRSNADISIPLKGSKKDGTLYAVAYKQAGAWTYERMEVAVEGREERIDLLGEGEQ